MAAGTAALQMKNSAVLLISCPDRKGIVATISDFVFNHDGNILHADEHADEGSNLFLMRVEFDPTEFDIDLADFSRHFTPIAEEFKMQWRLARSNCRPSLAGCGTSVFWIIPGFLMATMTAGAKPRAFPNYNSSSAKKAIPVLKPLTWDWP